MATITSGMISATVNGIAVNTTLECNSGNYATCTSRTVNYVVMHYTGNKSDTAKANATYFQTSGRNASAHFFVDDSNIYQSVKLRNRAWHCGGTTYYHDTCRNTNAIGIEMCTSGNYKISDTTKTNAAYLCAYICNLLGITATKVDTYVLRHYDVTHKECPAQMAGSSNSEWTAFKTQVKAILNGTDSTTTTTKTTEEEDDMTEAEVKKIVKSYFADCMADYEEDVSKKDVSNWAKPAFEAATEAGVLDGTSPQSNVNRQMLAQVLLNLGFIGTGTSSINAEKTDE